MTLDRAVERAQEVEEVAPHVAVAVDRAGRDLDAVARASRRTSVRRRRALEVDVQLGERDASRRAPRSAAAARPARRRPRTRRARARRRARRAAASRAWTTASGRPPGPTSSPSPATSTSPTAWSIALVLAQPPAAELEHGDADLAHVDRAARARRSRGRPRARAARAAGGGRGRRAGRPARRARRTCAAKRSAAAPEASASPAAARAAASSSCEPAEPQQRRAQRERDLEQPRLGGARVRSARRATRAPRRRCRPCGRAPGPCR